MNERKTLQENNEPTFPRQMKGSKLDDRLDKKTIDERAVFAPKNDQKTEKLKELTRARLRQPQDQRLKAAVYEEVKQVLEEDPSLVYQDETEAAYQVMDHAQEILIVPKERAVPEPFPVQRPEPIRKAYRFLFWSVLGLLFSGLGALLFAPAAGLHAARALGQTGSKDHARARVVLILAVLIFGLGLALAYLFWLHVQG